jgi:tricarboxylate carrier
MSGFVPFGIPVVVGMLIPSSSLLNTAFWQWLNQSHNACVNYCNRPISSTEDFQLQSFLKGYAVAVGSAASIAMGLELLIRNNKNPATQRLLKRFVPYPAVATANVMNILFMRRSELDKGIMVRSSDGTELGLSKVAARKALFDTAVTRVVLPLPVLVLPSTIMALLEQKTRLFQRFPRALLPIQTVVCTFSFGLALPLAISLFPQQGKLETLQLEPQFQQLRDSKGNPIDFVVYNKGL